ncbi:hypothetical protein [Olleya sp. R77988]|uniref:hypothetical protein n=1 Tax=Olleya sp. R77988 TaxID=3093875 RepID=UPI0037C72218
MKKGLIILLLFPIVAWSQAYAGYVGKIPIHLEISINENDDDPTKGRLDGCYFYDSKLISIPLSGVFDNDNYTMVDGYHYFEDSVNDADEVFNLQKNGNQLIGTLKLKEDTFKVVLTKTEEDPIDDYRDPKLTFIKDSVSTYQDKQLVWFHEKYSGAQLFRLGNGFTQQQRETFNLKLDSLHLEDATGALDCNSWFELSHTIHLVDSQFISFRKSYSVYCGGAHPSHGTVGYTFDLTTLKLIDTIETLYPEVDFFKLLKDKYQDETDEFQDECDVFTEASNWDYKQWNLTPKGVNLTPSYPHAMTACEDDYFLSYDEISKD